MLAKTETQKTVLLPCDLSPDSESEFFAKLDELLDCKPDELVIDCALLERVTSSHINIMWRSHSRCIDAGVKVKYSSVSINLKRVLMILDLYDLMISKPIGFTELTGHDMPISSKYVGKKLDLEFTTGKSDIDNAIEDFRRFLKMVRPPEFTAFELETIFYEVVTNIKLHGKISEGSIIKAVITITSRGITMCFIDRGVPFDSTIHVGEFDPDTAAGNQQKRGYGMVMIKRMTDKIDYERQDDCLNVLTLEKYWR